MCGQYNEPYSVYMDGHANGSLAAEMEYERLHPKIKNDLYIRGSRDPICVSGDRVKIGCREESIEYWTCQGEHVGELHGYTPEQILEYKGYLFYVIAPFLKNKKKKKCEKCCLPDTTGIPGNIHVCKCGRKWTLRAYTNKEWVPSN